MSACLLHGHHIATAMRGDNLRWVGRLQENSEKYPILASFGCKHLVVQPGRKQVHSSIPRQTCLAKTPVSPTINQAVFDSFCLIGTHIVRAKRDATSHAATSAESQSGIHQVGLEKCSSHHRHNSRSPISAPCFGTPLAPMTVAPLHHTCNLGEWCLWSA